MKVAVASLFALLVLVSCDMSVTTTDICKNNLSDVGIEGKYIIPIFGDPIEVEIIKQSKIGHYSLDYDDDGVPEQIELKTCKFDDSFVVDGLIYSDSSGEYFNTVLIGYETNSGLGLESIAISTEKLKALGIAFSEEENQFGSNTVIIEDNNITLTQLQAAAEDYGNPMAINLVKKPEVNE